MESRQIHQDSGKHAYLHQKPSIPQSSRTQCQDRSWLTRPTVDAEVLFYSILKRIQLGTPPKKNKNLSSILHQMWIQSCLWTLIVWLKLNQGHMPSVSNTSRCPKSGLHLNYTCMCNTLHAHVKLWISFQNPIQIHLHNDSTCSHLGNAIGKVQK